LVLPVVCLSLAVVAATIFACRVFLNLVSRIRRALCCRETQALQIAERKADSYFRRTSAEYERDVMAEVDRLTDVVIGDDAQRAYTEDGYIRDVRKEADRTANVVINEMQFSNAELDVARDRERAVTKYRKDVMEDAAKIVDAVIEKMKLEKECSFAIWKERKSAAYVEDVKSGADKVVDDAIKKTKVIYKCYDDCSGRTCTKSPDETRIVVKDLLKHARVEGAQKYARDNGADQQR
ncbi:hypothetical protein, partial [Anaplasma bovis]|uniref:hypothetical protein n=1 Tax=Anaplasma bovis TaxID=186733 RepID=UPI002FEFAB9B